MRRRKLENKRKNDADNRRYEEGYRDGRDGSDPGKDIAGGILGLNGDAIYRAGREKGYSDRQKYQKREGPSKDEERSQNPKKAKSSRREDRSYSPSGNWDYAPRKRPLSQTLIWFTFIQIAGALALYTIGPVLSGLIGYPESLGFFVLWACYNLLRIALMLFLFPGMIFWWMIFPDFIGSAMSSMNIMH